MSNTQQTLAQMVRSKYPGAYDDMDDVSLEKSVLSKHPEYSDLPTTKPSASIGPQASKAKQIFNAGFTPNQTEQGLGGIHPLDALSQITKEIENYTQEGRAEHPVLARIGDITKGAKDWLAIAGPTAMALSGPASAEEGAGIVKEALPDAETVGNKLASIMRKPATPAQSMAGVPGSVRQIPFVPKELQPKIPEALIPKGELGTPTNPGPYNKIPGRVSASAKGDPFLDAKARFEAAKASKAAPDADVNTSVLPEPRAASPTDRPGAMWSIPRGELPAAAQRGAPGAGDVLQNLNKPIIYTPKEGVGYPGPRQEANLSDLAGERRVADSETYTGPERRTFLKGVSTAYDQPTEGEKLAQQIRATRAGPINPLSEGEALQRIMKDPEAYQRYKLADRKTRDSMLVKAKMGVQ